MHAQGAIVKRVWQYLQIVQLPEEDQSRWGDKRLQLFELVDKGRWGELEADSISAPLLRCLQDLRATLAPGLHEGQALPRRCTEPLEKILPLHCFLTARQRPPSSIPYQPPPPPDEEDVPEDMQHAAAATGISEKTDFWDREKAGQGGTAADEGGGDGRAPAPAAATAEVGSREGGVAAAGAEAAPLPTPGSTRPYAPIARWGRKHAPLDGTTVAYMVDQDRLDTACRRVSEYIASSICPAAK